MNRFLALLFMIGALPQAAFAMHLQYNGHQHSGMSHFTLGRHWGGPRIIRYRRVLVSKPAPTPTPVPVDRRTPEEKAYSEWVRNEVKKHGLDKEENKHRLNREYWGKVAQQEQDKILDEQKRWLDAPDPKAVEYIQQQAKAIQGTVSEIKKDFQSHHMKARLDKQAREYLKTEVKAIQAQVKEAEGYVTYAGNQALATLVIDYAAAKAQAIGEFTEGVAKGFYKGFLDTAQVMKKIYENPLVIGSITRAIVHEAAHPERFGPKAVHAFWKYYTVMAFGSASEKGHALGEFGANLVQSLVLAPANAALTGAFKNLTYDMASTGLGARVGKEVLPKLEVPLRTDIEAVKKSIVSERIGMDRLRGCEIQKLRDANWENNLMKVQGYEEPYLKGSTITDFKTTQSFDNGFARLHLESNRERPWVVKKSDAEGLTAAQLQLKYSLPQRPKFISDVAPPAGTEMSISRASLIDFSKLERFKDKGSHPVAEHLQGDIEGAFQYEIRSKVDPGWFSNTKELE